MVRILFGDRILVKQVKGFRPLSELISGATFSKYSHAEPILNEKGDSIDATWPRVKRSNIDKYFDGRHRVKILRPIHKMDKSQEAAWLTCCIMKVGKWYNLWHRNCAGVVYDADRLVGILGLIKQEVFTPQMYLVFADGGCVFETIFEAECPTEEDFKKLVEG